MLGLGLINYIFDTNMYTSLCQNLIRNKDINMSKLIKIRSSEKKNYITIDTYSIRDKNLSWKAKGLHIYLTSCPLDWKIWRKSLMKEATDGDSSLRSAIKELMDNNYLKIEKEKDESGKYSISNWMIIENPSTYDPHVENPHEEVLCAESPHVENLTYKNIIYKNKEGRTKKEDNKDISSGDIFIKNKKVHSAIFNKWNSAKIIIHRELPPSCREKIDLVLKYVSIDVLLESIQLYGEIVNDDRYYFTYRWSLEAFLERGLSKRGLHQKGFWMFTPESNPKERFLSYKNADNDPFEPLRKKFIPTTTVWTNTSILDEKRNTYYGFKLDMIKRYFNRVEDLDEYLSLSRDNITGKRKSISFTMFCELEFAIAALFFHRKSLLDSKLGILNEYMTIWIIEKDRFGEQAKEMREEI